MTKAKKCPRCGSDYKQKNNGKSPNGSQRCYCCVCKYSYIPEPKGWAIPEQIRKLAIKEYYAGVSGRGVGKIHGFAKENVVRWIHEAKKNQVNVDISKY